MDRLTLRRTAYGTSLGVVVYHVLAHLLFGADFHWRDVLTTAAMLSVGGIAGLLIRDSLRADADEQDPDPGPGSR